MKKILLLIPSYFIIIQFIFISPCYPSCSICTNDALSNVDTMLCIGCATNYYEIPQNDGTFNCYADYEIIDGYYYDNLLHKFLNCNPACKRCYGEEEYDDTNCIICNTNEDYYPIDENPTFCKKLPDDAAYLQGYYLDDDENKYKKCYSTCASCTGPRDDSSHNCIECKDGYYKNGNSCFLDCPDYLFREGYKCVSACEVPGNYLDLFTKTCTNNCTTGSAKNDALGICTIERSSHYRTYDCGNIITDYIEPNMKFFISPNSLIRGMNCYIQVYNSLDQFIIHNVAERNMISKLFLSGNYINNNIIVIKIDYNETYRIKPEVNDIKFFLYVKDTDDNYNKITGLDLVTPIESDDLIYIEKNLNFLIFLMQDIRSIMNYVSNLLLNIIQI